MAVDFGSIYTTNTSGSGSFGSHTHTFAPQITYSPDYWTTGINTSDWWNNPPSRARRWPTDPPKEKNVKSEIKDVVSKRRAKKIEAAVDKIEAFLSSVPEDDGIAVGWATKFSSGDKTYQYVAVQAEKRWYITNRVGAISRDELLELLVEHELEGGLKGPRWAPVIGS